MGAKHIPPDKVEMNGARVSPANWCESI